MAEAFKAIKNGFGIWRQIFIAAIPVNLIFLVCSATGVLLPPAVFGLNAYTFERLKGRPATFETFWRGALHYLGKSYLWAGLNAVFLALAWINMRFYGNLSSDLGGALQWFFYLLGLIWLMMQMYLIPYVIQLTEESVWLALRNSLFTVLAFPLYGISLFIMVVLVSGAGTATLFPLLMGLPVVLSLIGQSAVQDRLEVAHRRVREQQEEANQPEPSQDNEEGIGQE